MPSGSDKLRPGDLSKSIAIESGELLEIFQWDNPELEAVKADPVRLGKVKKKLADVLIYGIELSTLLGLDTKQIILDKIEKAKEKYPADLFRAAAGAGDPGTDALYWKIKKEHRQNAE